MPRRTDGLTGIPHDRDIACMRLLDANTAEAYLRDTCRIAPDQRVSVTELTGGVSNMVLLVEPAAGEAPTFVVKQARAQLRTSMPWYASVERIWREAEVLMVCARLIQRPSANDAAAQDSAEPPLATTPRILFEDRDNYLFAMTAAERPNTVWKQQLLTGQADPRVASACGQLLGTLHGESWGDPLIARQLADRTLFDQLRIDPYCRTLAQVRPELADALAPLIESITTPGMCLVHADFSPKNLLVAPHGLMMVDFETGHYGDPAFDLGFFLSHLVLKACYHLPRYGPFLDLADAFWQAYFQRMTPRVGQQELAALKIRGLQNLAGCAAARLDGKSPVEYLTRPASRAGMRTVCDQLFEQHPADWPVARGLIHGVFNSTISASK